MGLMSYNILHIHTSTVGDELSSQEPEPIKKKARPLFTSCPWLWCYTYIGASRTFVIICDCLATNPSLLYRRMHPHEYILAKGNLHRRRIDLEDKTKVVAYAWGAESLPR